LTNQKTKVRKMSGTTEEKPKIEEVITEEKKETPIDLSKVKQKKKIFFIFFFSCRNWNQ